MTVQSYLCSKPVRPIRQAHGPEVLEGRAHGPEVLEGSIFHLYCDCGPKTKMSAIIEPPGPGSHMIAIFLSDRAGLILERKYRTFAKTKPWEEPDGQHRLFNA